jgi:hypothetical protein
MDGQNIWLTKKKIGISSGFFMGIWEYHGNRMGISWEYSIRCHQTWRAAGNSVGKMDIEIGKTMERNEMKDLPANRV